MDQVTLTERVKPGMLTRLHGGQGGIVMTAGTGGLLEIRRHKGGGTMKLTEREYMIQHVAYEKGKIKAWQHIRIICNSCIRAHREELTKQRTRQLVEMNSYRCRKEKP